MFRSLNPKKQAAQISAFVAQYGGNAPHAQVLELVARLNGAPYWTALQGAKRKPVATPVTRATELLMQTVESGPAPVKSALGHSLPALVDALAPGASTEKQALNAAIEALEQLKLLADELQQAAWRQLGFNRLAKRSPAGYLPVALTAIMYDDEQAWCAGSTELSAELLSEVLSKGVLTVLSIEFPRSDRYGVPQEATFAGAQEWLWNEGFCVLEDFDLESADRGDDGMMSCTATVLVPPELAAQLEAPRQ